MKEIPDSVFERMIDKGLKREDVMHSADEMVSFYTRIRGLERALPTKVSSYRGRGNDRADIMVVSDIPDEHEENTGLVGFSSYSAILNIFFNKMGINFQDVYWTTAIKHIPSRVDMTVIKKDFQYLQEEILFVDPAVIIVLGTTAISSLAAEPIKIQKALGKEFSYDVHPSLPSIPVIPLTHPKNFMDEPKSEFRQSVDRMWQTIKQLDSVL